jgi:hypothetical protein
MKKVNFIALFVFVFFSFISVGSLMAKFNDNTPHNDRIECDNAKWDEFRIKNDSKSSDVEKNIATFNRERECSGTWGC